MKHVAGFVKKDITFTDIFTQTIDSMIYPHWIHTVGICSNVQNDYLSVKY